MKIEGTIVEILPERSGTTPKGEYKFIPLVIKVLESCNRFDGTLFVKEHHIMVDLGGRYAQNFSLPVGSNVIIDTYFALHEKDGRKYQSIRSNYIVLK